MRIALVISCTLLCHHSRSSLKKQLVKIERTTANLCRQLISFIFIQYRWFPLHESSLSMRGSYIWSSREAAMTRESRESASGAFTRWHFQPPCSTVTLALRVAAARAGNYVWPASGARSLLPVPGSGPAQGFPRRHSSNYPGNRRAAPGRKRPRADLCQR